MLVEGGPDVGLGDPEVARAAGSSEVEPVLRRRGVSEMARMMFADCFLTVTPCRRTSSGLRLGHGQAVLDSTWASSRLVPISNVIVS